MVKSMAVGGFIPVDPMPAPRPRFTVRGKFPVAYTPAEYRKWKDATAAAIKAGVKLPEGWPKDAPLAVGLTFSCARPKTTKLAFPKPDIDNYEKAFLDAGTDSGVLWDDDCQIVSLSSAKMWTPDVPGIGFNITVLQNP